MLLPRSHILAHVFTGLWLSALVLIALLATACNAGTPPPPSTEGATAHESLTAASLAPQPFPDQPLRFERISLEQGLSQSTVNCILQDRYGFMWFGTQDGLNRYDGYNFTIYRHRAGDADSLSANYIWSLAEDQDGGLWIATDGGGLDRFDRNTGKFIHYQAGSTSDSLTTNFIRVVYPDREGTLWVGTNGGGLHKFDRVTGRFTRYQQSGPDSLSSNFIRAIYEDQAGALWIGTDGGGLDRFDRSTGRFTHYQHEPGNPNSLGNDAVTTVLEDQSGRLWIGTAGSGLDQFDRATGRFTHYRYNPNDPHSLSQNVVQTIYEDRAGSLWVSTFGGGLNRFDRDREQFIRYQNDPSDPHSLSDNSILSLYEDRGGILWIGTSASGLATADRSAAAFALYQVRPNDANSLSQNSVWTIYQDQQGLLWIGTSGGGLDRLDRSTGQFTHYRHDPADPNSLSNNVIRVIREDHEGMLWLGMNGGQVDRFDRATGRFSHYPITPGDSARPLQGFILSIYEDRDGTLWIGTSGAGPQRLDRQAGRFVPYQSEWCDLCLSTSYVKALYEDQAGSLWVGTGGEGLVQLDQTAKRIVRYRANPADPQSLSHDIVQSILQDRSGVLWVGTWGGLNRFDAATETFTQFTQQDGLPNDLVYGILEDEQGYLWLSTNAGLTRFDPRANTFENYDASDGLQSNEFNAGAFFQSVDGELFFGGIDGFNSFYPDQIKRDNPYLPPVILTALTQNGNPVTHDLAAENLRAITFQWPNNSFEFEFAALSFAQPEKNQYAYQLDGFDQAWNASGTQRFGRYTNLPGGTYTLRLKASNKDGVWNEQGAALTITIVPPFWETWWFRGAIGLLVIGGLIGGYRLRVKSIETQRRELQAQVAQRTAELQQEIEQRLRAEEALRQSELDKAVTAERSRLARDLHDVVTQSLFSASLVAEALPTAWKRDAAEGQQLLQELRQLTRGALAEMRTLLLELRPAALVEADLGNLLRQLAEAFTGRDGLPITVTVEGNCNLPAPVHIALYRIAQEALNNISKHACAQQVSIDLRRGPLGRAELRIQDDGCGFDQHAVAAEHLGLNIMRERADSIGASLTIESEPGHGTRLTVIWQEQQEMA